MVKRWAIIRNDQVENVALWDGETEWAQPEGTELVELGDDEACGPGFTYDGKNFNAPKPAPSDEPAP